MAIGSTPSSSGPGDQATEDSVEVVLDAEETFGGVWEAFARGDRAALATHQVRQAELDRTELERIAFGRRLTDPNTGTLQVETPSGRKNIVKAWLSTQAVSLCLLSVDMCGAPTTDVGETELEDRDVGKPGYKLCGLGLEANSKYFQIFHIVCGS